VTDYAKPVTAAEVCKRLREDVEVRAKQHREAARLSDALAQELEGVARTLIGAEMDRYERYQPAPEPSK